MRGVGRRCGVTLAATLWVGLVGLPGPAAADGETRLRVGSVVATALYAPAKVLYAATGVLAGGLGWGISGGNREAMEAVMTPAVRGDYVITPEHLRGERSLEFVGVGPDAPARSGAASQEDALALDEYLFYE